MGASLNLDRITKDKDSTQSVDSVTEGAVKRKAFNVWSANQVLADAAKQPIPNMLFSEFIFEGELTTLYAPTNRGKSFLALHIAHLIASGKSLDGLENEAPPQKVIFFDLELSKLQFGARYSEEYKDAKGKRAYKNQFKFHENLMIAKFAASTPPKGVDQVDWYFSQIKETAEECGAKIIFLDNISWLSGKGLEKMEDAKKLIERLLKLVKQNGYTIIVLAHTPKIGDNTPITMRDLAGSAGLGNFCDAAFIINESWSQGKPYKYLKQNKCRSAIKVYDESNVLTVMMEQIEPNFVGFRVAPDSGDEYKYEAQHLHKHEILNTVKYSEQQVAEAKLLIHKAVKDDPDISGRKLEMLSGVCHTTALKYKKEVQADPQLWDGFSNPKTDLNENSI
tara:strand:- start:594 stop:1772 length:1179 start_codon:yes stop_codon:yes gene_type:complete